MKPSIVFVLFLFLFSSCKNNDLDSPISLIFGVAYGYCIGDCAHFYKIELNTLYEDNIERYDDGVPTFETTPMSNTKFELAKDLINEFPPYLMENKNQTFGCPDCTDQGGIHLYYTFGNQQYFWHIDTFAANQPPQIRDYINKVKDVIVELRK